MNDSSSNNNSNSVTGNWEELFDSGQLDRQLQQLKPFHTNGSSNNTSPTIISVSGGALDDPSARKSPPLLRTPPTDGPEPKLKILKRPSSSPNFGSSSVMAPGHASSTSSHPFPHPSKTQMNSDQLNQHKKSFKQREEEYAQARLRILGSAGGSPDLPDFSVPPPPLPVKFMQQQPPTRSLDNAPIARPPRGPDGSKGFQK
eukprot:TRINITY_DN4111_c0_g1_i1.p1 TRINITY_DN4111_c0_g1~~TRINITY_DN4111_c0_g1_i1.p1  ORF type:complete len:201 (-),score=61.29 TRINITY_DN4111_c0_g1_i1:244-846(-)